MKKSEGANRARAILEDVLVVEAFAKIRERHLAAFEHSAPDDLGARERAFNMLRAANQLKSELQEAIEDEAIRKVRKRGND